MAAPSSPPLKRGHCRLVFLGLVAVVLSLVAATHWPVLSAQALFFDDQQYLTNNELVQQPSWTSARRFLTEVVEPSSVEGYYQPLTMISLMLDYAAGGRPEDLRVFRRTSLALHLCNTALVMALLYLLFGQPWIAAIAGLLFGVHPIAVEPVAWVAERKTLLAALFSLSALVFYVRYTQTRNRLYMTAALPVYILALLSKPSSTPLPLLMLLLDWWPLRRLGLRAITEKLGFLVLASLSAIITIESQRRTAGASMPSEYPTGHLPLILCHNIIFYLFKTGWPADLSPYYPVPEPFTLWQPAVLSGVIGTFVLLAALLISLHWTRAALTGWLFFLVAILPTMGIIGFTDVIAADRFAYLPLVGLLLPLVCLLQRTWDAAPRRAVLCTLAIIAAASEAAATRRYVAYWQNSAVLSRYVLTWAPHAAAPHHLLGVALFEQGRIDEAITQYREALRQGDDAKTHHDLGTALALQGNLEEATAQFRDAVRIRPNLPVAHHNLAVALAQQGNADESIPHFREAIRLKPTLVEARKNLADILAERGDLDEAIAQDREALRLKPDFADAHNDLGAFLLRQGHTAEAITHFAEALRLQPDYTLARESLAAAHVIQGEAFEDQGNTNAAIHEYQEALRVMPDSPDARRKLAAVVSKPDGG